MRFGFNWAKMAALKAMHRIVTKKRSTNNGILDKSLIKIIIAAAEPIQLCPIIAMAE